MYRFLKTINFLAFFVGARTFWNRLTGKFEKWLVNEDKFD